MSVLLRALVCPIPETPYIASITIQTRYLSLNNGIIPIYEPGLKELVGKNVKNERLIFTEDMDFAVKKTDVIFIAVGTPPQENGEADLSNVFRVAESIANSINGYKSGCRKKHRSGRNLQKG
jgi:Predicted UDP-glucose 6-dehydrogenase